MQSESAGLGPWSSARASRMVSSVMSNAVGALVRCNSSAACERRADATLDVAPAAAACDVLSSASPGLLRPTEAVSLAVLVLMCFHSLLGFMVSSDY